MALLVLVGIIVIATVEKFDEGFGLCSEVVRRMHDAPPPVAASVFTLLVNVAAQATYAGSAWGDVERMVLSIFSRVVEAMDVADGGPTCLWQAGTWRPDEHGPENGAVHPDAAKFYAPSLFWRRAMKCGIALLWSGNRLGDFAVAHTDGLASKPEIVRWSKSRRPRMASPAISLRALKRSRCLF